MSLTQRNFSLVATLVVVFAITGCGTSSQVIEVSGPVAEMSASDREEVLRAEARRWSGTPHVWGGETQRGIDCSGLVYTLYRSHFGAEMPRTTREQVNSGRSVSRTRLQPGDLVFFRPTPKTRHVGIYLSDGEFLHAASSTGVSINHMSEPYWQRRYWTSRRVLPEPSTTPSPVYPVTDRGSTSTEEKSSARAGW